MAVDDRAYPSVWARPRRKARSPLTREQIVAQALQLLDAEGIDALSMRKLAARLEVGTTSLYWHVANRDELIELLIDEVYAEFDLPEVDDWRVATRQYAHSVRATVLRHRWLVSMLDHLVAAYPGPNSIRVTERMLAVFEAAGFELGEAEQAVSAVSAYVIGVSMAEASWHTWLARHGKTALEWMDAAKQVADETTQGHERTRQVAASYEGVDPRKATEADFEYGLERLLDGLRARIA